jgi:hypothetical protein
MRMAKIKEINFMGFGEDVGLTHCRWGWKMIASPWKTACSLPALPP